MKPEPSQQIRDRGCTLCPLYKGATHVCLTGSGPTSAQVMLVGDIPGADEDATGQPFVGQTGMLLDRALKDFAKLDRKDVYVTNAVKCRASNNASPKRKEIQTCVEAFLDEEVALVKPQYMVVMGNSALLGVLGKSGIMKYHGTPAKADINGHVVTVMPTLHPAAVLRNPKWGEDFALDMVSFGKLVRGERKTPATRIKIVRSTAHLKWLHRRLMEARVISWDVETYTEPVEKPYKHSNFQYWHENESHIVSIAFSWEEGMSVVIPLWHNESRFQSNSLVRKILRFLRRALERKNCTYVAHNGKYDASWMKAFGVNMPQSFDTMLASHVLEENREKKLKSLSRNVLGADGYDVGEDLKEAHTIPTLRLAVYNGKDSDYTLRLARHFLKELKADPAAARIFTKILMPSSRVLTEVEALGVCIDPDRWRAAHDRCQENCEKLHDFIERRVPKDMQPINLRSPDQVAALLFGYLEMPVTKTTKGGKPSTAEGVLMRLDRDNQIVPALLKYRKFYKYLSTYLLPWWFEHRDSNGRIRSSYKPAGTVTGRLAGQGGIQQIPRNTFIRSIVCAEKGWTLVAADYSQIELRIAALIANEKAMLRQFALKEDIHTLRAARIIGKRPEDVTKEERFRAKAVSFGFLYGMGAKKFVDYAFEEYDVTYTLKESEAARNGFFADYPAFLPWHARQRRLAQRYRQVSSPMGRVRHLPDILSNDEKVRGEAERQAINAPVQVTASDIMLLALIELHKTLPRKEARIIATIHDSIMFEVRDAHVEKWVPVIKDVMEDRSRVEQQFECEINVPIVADVEIGTHFGEGKEWSP